jgi:heptosyltransferase II
MKTYDCAIQLPNWVGDTVMATPLLSALKTLHLNCILLGKPWAQSLLNGFSIDTMIYPQNKHARIQCWKQINAKYTLVLPNSLSSALIPWLAGKKVIGMKTNSRRVFLKHPVKKNDHKHEVEYYWQLAKKVAAVFDLSIPATPPSHLTLPLLEKEKIKAREIIDQHRLEDFIIICPFAAGLHKGQSKVWPHWNTLINEIKQHGKNVICCPAPNETILCKEQVLGCKILENISLSTFAALCKKSACIISNDTGPMHIAAAVNPDKTCGVFGVTNPKLTAPWGAHYITPTTNQWPSVNDVLDWVQQQSLV